jgi:hypothetical protein
MCPALTGSGAAVSGKSVAGSVAGSSMAELIGHLL